jgi:peptidoglycan/LPS O-acetylase OafA/YrhL
MTSARMAEVPRIYALDAFRGVAALSVVVWHWQHFYMLDGVRSNCIRSNLAASILGLAAIRYSGIAEFGCGARGVA